LYCLHYLLHNNFIYKLIHSQHHSAIKPKPVHLFTIHPAETITYGILWLTALSIYSFNLYAIIIYLVVHVLFGINAHLGIDQPSKRNIFSEYFISSQFHRNHHYNIQKNYGFYTNIWDKVFGTAK